MTRIWWQRVLESGIWPSCSYILPFNCTWEGIFCQFQWILHSAGPLSIQQEHSIFILVQWAVLWAGQKPLDHATLWLKVNSAITLFKTHFRHAIGYPNCTYKHNRRFFWIFFIYLVFIQHCFICCPSDSTVPVDAGTEALTIWLGLIHVQTYIPTMHVIILTVHTAHSDIQMWFLTYILYFRPL